MANTLQPRQVDPKAHRQWMRDGARLLWRVSTGWMVAWFAFAATVLALVGDTAAAMLLVGISAPAFDLHLLMLDRAAANQRGVLQAASQAWNLLVERRGLYLRSAVVRIAWSLIIVAAYSALLLLIAKAAGGAGTETNASTTPPWINLFGIQWLQWGWVGCLPAVWQHGGLTSFHPWLVRRFGLDDASAKLLHSQARNYNPRQMLTLMFAGMGLAMLPITFLPILLPIADLYFAAIMRCAWQDIFEGGTKIEDAVAEQVQAGRLVAA